VEFSTLRNGFVKNVDERPDSIVLGVFTMEDNIGTGTRLNSKKSATALTTPKAAFFH
jgi:hypothetical protein